MEYGKPLILPSLMDLSLTDTKQRAVIAAKLATMERGGDRKSEKIKGSFDPLKSDALSIEQAAEALSVSPASVKRENQRLVTQNSPPGPAS